MKRFGVFLLALLMLPLCACTSEQSTQTAPTEPSPTDKAATKTERPDKDPAGGEDPVEQLLADEEGLLLAARRATAQAFDKLWYNCPPDGALLEEYYCGTGAQVADSALVQRAQALAAVTVEADRVKREDGKVLYLAALPRDGEWVEEWVELELDETDRPSKTVTVSFLTAELKDDRVFLTFTDTEVANYYLRDGGIYDYDEYGNAWGYDMPGDTLPIGPDHRYEVEGLFSRYKDLFVGYLSAEYDSRPHLFLVTEDNGLEMVDFITCFQYDFFCAMPLPGHFDEASLSAPVWQDEFGQDTVIVTGSGGEECDLSWYVQYARLAAPLGGWSGSIGEAAGSGGSWSRIANLTFESSMAAAWGDFTITELDEDVLGGDVDVITLGMTEDGIVSAFWWNTWGGKAIGAMAWRPGVETTEFEAQEVLHMKQLSNFSPLLDEDETATLYRSGSGVSDEVNELVAAFQGEWTDAVSGRCWMTVTPSGAGDKAQIRIEWGDSAAETYVWTMTGTPGQYDAALYYDDCTCRIVEYGENGAEIVKDTLYTGGSGGIDLIDVDTLCWGDENFERSRECRFTPANWAG